MRTEREADESPTLLSRALVNLVRAVCRAPWLVLALALIGCAISTYLSCTQLKFFTQRSDLVSQDKDYQKRWKAYLQEFGDDDDMVVVVQGRDRALMEKGLEHLADQIEQHSDLFDRLFYKVDLRSLHNRALLFKSDEEIAKVEQKIRQMNDLLDAPLLGLIDKQAAWMALTVRMLVEEGERRARDLKPGQPLSAEDKLVLGQVNSIVSKAHQTINDPAKYSNPASRPMNW